VPQGFGLPDHYRAAVGLLPNFRQICGLPDHLRAFPVLLAAHKSFLISLLRLLKLHKKNTEKLYMIMVSHALFAAGKRNQDSSILHFSGACAGRRRPQGRSAAFLRGQCRSECLADFEKMYFQSRYALVSR